MAGDVNSRVTLSLLNKVHWKGFPFLFTVANGWKQPKSPPTDEEINKMRSVHTLEYFSALEKGPLTHVTAWPNPWTLCSVKEPSHKRTNTG